MALTELNPLFPLLAGVNLLLCLVSAVLLAQRGRRWWTWLLLGLLAGFYWPLAALILLPARPRTAPPG